MIKIKNCKKKIILTPGVNIAYSCSSGKTVLAKPNNILKEILTCLETI